MSAIYRIEGKATAADPYREHGSPLAHRGAALAIFAGMTKETTTRGVPVFAALRLVEECPGGPPCILEEFTR